LRLGIPLDSLVRRTIFLSGLRRDGQREDDALSIPGARKVGGQVCSWRPDRDQELADMALGCEQLGVFVTTGAYGAIEELAPQA
jgi:hypothetical protein